jgi:succinate dehydrogenase flavin-adding protein (antitoxin of CptAB toxin-antitoxin module)
MDRFVKQVLSKYCERAEAGLEKYGTTLEREDLNLLDWLNHLQEELMDATL